MTGFVAPGAWPSARNFRREPARDARRCAPRKDAAAGPQRTRARFGGPWGPDDGPRLGFSGPSEGRRAGRGDVRTAVLALLTEGPRHGYQMIGEIASAAAVPGSRAPAPSTLCSALQDEGLVDDEKIDGKRAFSPDRDRPGVRRGARRRARARLRRQLRRRGRGRDRPAPAARWASALRPCRSSPPVRRAGRRGAHGAHQRGRGALPILAGTVASPLRASDQDRHEAVLALSEAFADGRLDSEGVRGAAVAGARRDLRARPRPAFADLPTRVAGQSSGAAGDGARRRRGPRGGER